MARNADSIWIGRTQTDWERVKIWNATEKTLHEHLQGFPQDKKVNLCSGDPE
jgi:hypothetical protein